MRLLDCVKNSLGCSRVVVFVTLYPSIPVVLLVDAAVHSAHAARAEGPELCLPDETHIHSDLFGRVSSVIVATARVSMGRTNIVFKTLHFYRVCPVHRGVTYPLSTLKGCFRLSVFSAYDTWL